MWNRQELKSNARIMLKANYLKIVIVSVVFALLTSSGYQSAKGAAKGSDADISLRHLTGIQWSLVVAAFVGIMGVVIIAFLVNALIAVFVWNPLSVGCIKYFIDCRYGNAEWKDILFVFRNNYVNVCVNIFLKQLFTFLWCLLLIVPGIVKAYEYMMVPYILAENPDMSREEVFERLNEVFRDVFDEEDITVDEGTTAEDIDGWDSLEHINLMAAVESEFGIKFSMGQIVTMKNVGEMADIILQKV